jgi:hypothetical protein
MTRADVYRLLHLIDRVQEARSVDYSEHEEQQQWNHERELSSD